ncbi:DNA-binding response regulator, partial [Pseudomonas aeruginosa]|nr:DNA-binding response regulator [Pseudomonas aeruginosa]
MEHDRWRIQIVVDDRRRAELTRDYLDSDGLTVDIEA